MTTTRIDPRPVRIPVKALSTSNITLSGPQTVDSVSCAAGDLVGALGQSDNKSAVYMVTSTAWIPVDPGLGEGFEVFALGGGTNGGTLYSCTTSDPITWGTTSTTFVKKSASGAVFDAANPGNIGTTSQGTIQATEIDAKTYASDTALPALLAGFMKLYGIRITGGTTDRLRILGGTGDSLELEFPNTTGTSRTRLMAKSFSLNAGSSVSAGTNGKGGALLVFGTSATGSAGGLVFHAQNGSVVSSGAATTNFDVADTALKLCAISGTNDVTVKNNLAGATDVTVIGFFHDAN